MKKLILFPLILFFVVSRDFFVAINGVETDCDNMRKISSPAGNFSRVLSCLVSGGNNTIHFLSGVYNFGIYLPYSSRINGVYQKLNVIRSNNGIGKYDENVVFTGEISGSFLSGSPVSTVLAVAAHYWKIEHIYVNIPDSSKYGIIVHHSSRNIGTILKNVKIFSEVESDSSSIGVIFSKTGNCVLENSLLNTTSKLSLLHILDSNYATVRNNVITGGNHYPFGTDCREAVWLLNNHDLDFEGNFLYYSCCSSLFKIEDNPNLEIFNNVFSFTLLDNVYEYSFGIDIYAIMMQDYSNVEIFSNTMIISDSFQIGLIQLSDIYDSKFYNNLIVGYPNRAIFSSDFGNNLNNEVFSNYITGETGSPFGLFNENELPYPSFIVNRNNSFGVGDYFISFEGKFDDPERWKLNQSFDGEDCVKPISDFLGFTRSKPSDVGAFEFDIVIIDDDDDTLMDDDTTMEDDTNDDTLMDDDTNGGIVEFPIEYIIIIGAVVVVVIVVVFCFVIVLVLVVLIVRKGERKSKDFVELTMKRETKEGMAKIKINESLFEVKYEDVKILKRIGN